MDLPDGAYVRGLQLSKIEVDDSLEVMRAELFLDGSRIAADDFAPFTLVWDTTGFDDGSHTLTARAYLTDGRHADGTTAIWIDNTPPVLGNIQSTAVGATTFTLDVSDNLKVAQVEVTRDVPGEPPVILTRPPFAFPWRWGCGTSTLRIHVLDAAGNETSATAKVMATDAADRDCDGFAAVAAGGADCNDDSAAAHPGAPEVPEGFDLNCDGVVAALDGVDSDRDGVPSISDGGDDCDDTDPAIHGAFHRYAHAAVRVGGVPVTWNAGEAVLVAQPGFWRLYLDRGGVIEQFTPGITDDDAIVRQVATDANPSSLSVRNGLVAFGRGNDVVILEQHADEWLPHAVLHAGAPVGKLFIDRSDGLEYTAFQTGTDIWFASSPDGLSWTIEHIDDLHQSLVQNPSGYAYSSFASFVFRTSQGAWTYTRSEGQAFQAVRVGPADQAPTAMTADITPTSPLVAVNDGNGSAIYRWGWQEPTVRTSKRVTAMTDIFPYVFVQLDGSGVEAFMLTRGSTVLRHAQTITGIGTSDTTSFGAFAGNGFVHYLTTDTVFAAPDPFDDHVDRDCNEHD